MKNDLFSYKKMIQYDETLICYYDCIFLRDFEEFEENDKVVEIDLNMRDKILYVKREYTSITRHNRQYNIELELKILEKE